MLVLDGAVRVVEDAVWVPILVPTAGGGAVADDSVVEDTVSVLEEGED